MTRDGLKDRRSGQGDRRAADGAAEPAGTEVIPLEWHEPAPPPCAVSRPDPSFVAHLIATAEKEPQTRTMRRAAIADVEAAYRSVEIHNHPPAPAGEAMRRSA
jgi:hypothetical protein